jgi:hypothetical protein
MKRLSYFVTTALLSAGLFLPAWSQSRKPPDPCAQFKTAPKGESAAHRRKRRANLKACTDKPTAQSKASKQTAPKK